jgi:hypothetical protein
MNATLLQQAKQTKELAKKGAEIIDALRKHIESDADLLQHVTLEKQTSPCSLRILLYGLPLVFRTELRLNGGPGVIAVYKVSDDKDPVKSLLTSPEFPKGVGCSFDRLGNVTLHNPKHPPMDYKEFPAVCLYQAWTAVAENGLMLLP